MPASVLCAIVSSMLERPLEEHAMVDTLRGIRLERMARLLHLRIARMEQDADRARALLEALNEDSAHTLLESPALCEILRTGRPAAELIALLASGASAPLPARLVNPSAGLQQPFIPDPVEEAQSRARIDAALTHLQATTAFGHGVFTGLVKEVVLRGDNARRAECWGASSGAAIGRVAVINTLASNSPAQLAEVLLHEATHCALDCAELVSPLAELDHAASTFVPSPWTGNPLAPHALIHASVVWAVLHEYWRACAGQAQAAARMRFIEQGFTRLDASGQPPRAAMAMELARRSVPAQAAARAALAAASTLSL